MSRRKILIPVIFIIILFAIALAYFAYKTIYGPNVSVTEPTEFIVDNDVSSVEILDLLKESQTLINSNYLDLIAEQMSFTSSTPKAGRYLISPGMSSYDILNMLRQGKQTPVSLTIRGMRKIENLAGFLGHQLQHDSLHYLQALRTDDDKSLCNHLPDTYEFYWTTNGVQFKERMSGYYHRFWDGKSTRILGYNFTPCDIYILASIVEKETTYDAEKADVAGVYINRLNRGMPLQADPTIIFALDDFSIQRVLTKYLDIDSPYNTYKYAGLPPGPICMPSKSSLEAVLNANKHDYIYFCAKPDISGTHAFAETLAQHNRNARAFQRWLNQRGIKR